MASTIKMRASASGDVVEVKMLMSHPMANGLTVDADGNLVNSPTVKPDYIKTVKVTSNGKTVMAADWSSAISKDPYLAFRFKGGKAGDKVQAEWVDTSGQTGSGEVTISQG